MYFFTLQVTVAQLVMKYASDVRSVLYQSVVTAGYMFSGICEVFVNNNFLYDSSYVMRNIFSIHVGYNMSAVLSS